MKQEQFMQTLRQGLTSLPKKEVDEIVADYREYISDAVAAGRNEEEVIAALGDPAKLARELKAQASYRQWESHRSFSNLMRVVISVAGLGVMNFFLFFPFMVYLMLLTAGYMVSVAFMVAGVVMVIAAGGNKLFNWPQFSLHDNGSFAVNGHMGASKLIGLIEDDGHARSDTPEIPKIPAIPGKPHKVPGVDGLKVDKDHFVFNLSDGEEAHLTLVTGGPVTLESDDGKISVDSDDPKVRALIVDRDDGGVSVARKDVRTIDLENADGENFSYVAGSNPGETHLRVHSNDGDVSIDRDDKHDADHFSVGDGKSAVSIDNNQISINDGNDHIHIGTHAGWSIIMMVLLFGIGFMIAGALGFWLCIYISRLTWHGLSRYVKYQISVVTGKESLLAAE